MDLRRYNQNTRITNYYPIPRSILSLKLPSTSVLIYGILLDRATLSQKHDYTDAAGWVYVVYTQEELAKDLDISTRMTAKYILCLEKAGLIRKVRTSRKQANRYYLMLPSESVTGTGSGTMTGTFVPADRKNQVLMTGTYVPPNNRKEQQDISNLYQHSEGESL